ncbi:hypothetical protein F5Y09DRAFT_355949 [Xylaria sp. FL1042]|nr:hypothetical protein F5Y09DRAFT_355949 [Xylaria sp. FL1042]
MGSTEEPISQVEITEESAMQTTHRALTPIIETDSKAESCVTRFHRDADLQVFVKTPHGDSAIYMVCGSAVACASVVWRSMLYYHDPTYAHDANKRDQTQTMSLDGDPGAIGLIFRIIHYDFSYVPKEPTLEQLFELGKSACQYRCTHILYPWAEQWTSRMSNFVADDNCYAECHKALYVAWTFGELKLLRDMVDALIVSSEIDVNGKIVNIRGQPLEEMLMPRELLDIIVKTRASTISNILDTISKPIRDLSQGEHSQRITYCKVGKDSQACEVMMLGSVIPHLTQAGLFPIPEHEKFTGSVEYLKNQLENIKTIPYVGKEWMPHMSHEGCNLGFRESVMACLKSMAVPLGSSIMTWMSDQAKTCGIEPTRELEEWQLTSKDVSPELPAKSDLVRQLEKAKEELDHASSGSAQGENLEVSIS